MEKWKEGFQKAVKTCYEGEITIPKTTLWLVGLICLLAGIVYGLLAAPWTHGVTIGCNNGNTENHYGDGEEEDQAE